MFTVDICAPVEGRAKSIGGNIFHALVAFSLGNRCIIIPVLNPFNFCGTMGLTKPLNCLILQLCFVVGIGHADINFSVLCIPPKMRMQLNRSAESNTIFSAVIQAVFPKYYTWVVPC